MRHCFSGGMAVNLTSVADINVTSYYEGLYQLAKDAEIEGCQCDLASNHFFFCHQCICHMTKKMIS